MNSKRWDIWHFIATIGEDVLSRTLGNQYEKLARSHLESLGLVFIASNIVVNGGEIDLLMQSTVNVGNELCLGEVCIVEVKGRGRFSQWNDEVVSAQKVKRWALAAQYVLWRLEDGEWDVIVPITGIQFVLVRIEKQTVEVTWHATDLDLG